MYNKMLPPTPRLQALDISDHNTLFPLDLRTLFNTAFQATTTNQTELALKPICHPWFRATDESFPHQAFSPTCYFTNHKPFSEKAIDIGNSYKHERPTLGSGGRLVHLFQSSLPPIPTIAPTPPSLRILIKGFPVEILALQLHLEVVTSIHNFNKYWVPTMCQVVFHRLRK